MKRVVVFILALLLLLDLAEGGCFGKATFVAPQSSAKTSLLALLHHCSGKIESPSTLPPDGGAIFHLRRVQTPRFLVNPALKIIICIHISSSGGIPL
jgi:hypothetical protein